MCVVVKRMNPWNAVWPEWEVVREIGRGSFGTVYEAVRREYGIESRAAIKCISIPAEDDDPERYRREGLDETAIRETYRRIAEDVIREIEFMQSVKDSPNIVGIEDYKVVGKKDSPGWDIFIRMELLTPLTEWLCDRETSEADAVRLGTDLCRALETCDRMQIIHRDIKPENIFISSLGTFKLGDFGISRKLESMTYGLTRIGTANYMAPEIYREEAYDRRADQYSLGLVLYWMLNGRRLPFLPDKQILSPADRNDAFRKRIRGEVLPPPRDASARMTAVIRKACAPKPEERYPTPAAFREALEKVDGGKAAAASKSGAWKKRAALFLILAALITGGILIESRPWVEPPDPTEAPAASSEAPEPASDAVPAADTSTLQTQTPAPGPGEKDLRGCSDRLVHPDEGSWLDDYETQYVKTQYGNRAYLRYAPEEESDHDEFVKEKDQVTVLARQNGFSLVITENRLIGWVTSGVLVYRY